MNQTICIFFAALALLPAAPASASPSCRLPGGRTIATDAVAKLIELPTPSGEALFACIRRTGRKIALDTSFADARLSGRWVAWQRHVRGTWRIDVHDLRSGRERLVIGHVADHAIFLTTTGTIVWAQRLDQDVGVFANALRSGGRLLDRGAIEPTSLHLSGRHASWQKDGQAYSADVP